MTIAEKLAVAALVVSLCGHLVNLAILLLHCRQDKRRFREFTHDTR